MFVVATDSQRRDETLFLVDRSKERRSFWSNCLDSVKVFKSEEEAAAGAKSLRYNNPRVMALSIARSVAAGQVAPEECELGTFAYKEA